MLVVSISRPHLRETIIRALSAAGYTPTTVDPESIRNLDSGTICVLSTDDLSLLHQIVYNGRFSNPPPETAPKVIALADACTIANNPRIAAWDIHGHAALACLIPVQNDEIASQDLCGVVQMVRRLTRT